MSALILNDSRWNEELHEELLIISLLRKGTLQRKELKERIRSIQKAKSASFEPHLPNQYHSNSAYNYWIRYLKKREIIAEDEFNKVLSLTSLGKWIASSKLGSLFERNSFLESFICKKCSALPNIVLLAPLLDSIDASRINAKGQIWVDLRCPKCRSMITHLLGFSNGELVKFYNQAVAELGQFVKLEASRI